jgi:lipopolysaccharide transport system permease protein
MGRVVSQDSEFAIIIEPSRGWARVDWRDLARYRDLLFLLVRREFVVKYNQTILGPLWAVLQPLLTALVFVAIFARVAKIPTANVPPLLFYLLGLAVWTFFAQSLASISTALRANAALFSKVYFPRLVIPLSSLVSYFVPLAILLAVFLAVYLYYGVSAEPGRSFGATLWVLALPLLLVQTALLSLGIGLIAASLTVKYRDLSHLIPFLLQIGMYVTPIIYPLTLISERWRFVVALNPMTAVVELARSAFFGTPPISGVFILLSVASTLILLAAGLALFGRVERNFVDTV